MNRNYDLKMSIIFLYLLIGFFFIQKTPVFAESKNVFNDNKRLEDSVSAYRICEERYVKINEIEQWITIKGNKLKPAILFLHGGPGNPLSPYSDSIYHRWEKDFIIVQWDQRGAGRTYGRTAPDELTSEYLKTHPLTLGQMVSDGIELTEYLLKYLGKQKIILYGASWGTELGVELAIKRPDLFYAYVGTSQVVNPSEDLLYDYQQIYSKAQSINDQKTINTMDSIGLPPYDNVRNAGKLFKIIKNYERQYLLSVSSFEPSWLKMAHEYDNEKDKKYREDGDDYSFVNYIGDRRFVTESIMSKINFLKDGLVFSIPVYLIQGEADLLTPKVITENYFNKIRAPKKNIFLVPKATHGVSALTLETEYKVLKYYILPSL